MTQTLPIDAIKTDFLSSIQTNNTLILTAPPGAGKSTCLPLWLLSMACFAEQKIYLLQPRRVAAKNIACFLSKQLGENVGKTVGYRFKNEVKVSSDTRMEVITEGILTNIIQNDPELEGCGLVIFDEFHERSLQGDLAFALARDVQQGLRDDLKILLMSATLEIEPLTQKLPEAICLASEGRSYPVDITYAPAPKVLNQSQSFVSFKQWREHALFIINQQLKSHQGSILVFLPGVADIKYLCQQLAQTLPQHFSLAPLYGELPLSEQQLAIAPTKNNVHKLVLATNIAETSLTIEGVNLVIDCGYEKSAVYDPKTLTNKLQQQAISKASATQRAGRAGRLVAGSCIRLYSKENYDRRDESNTSDIQQADLLPFVIEASRWGVSALKELPLIELPSSIKEKQAWQELKSLSIVNEQQQLTQHGKSVANMPTHPRFAHMIVMAKSLQEHVECQDLVQLACLIAATLEERDIFERDRAKTNCNLVHRLEAILQRHNHVKKGIRDRVIKQANHLFNNSGMSKSQVTIGTNANLPLSYVGMLLALAYPERIAKQRNVNGQLSAEYLTTGGKGVSLHEEDALLIEPFLVVAQVGQYSFKNKETMIIQLAAVVDIELLIALNIVFPIEKLHATYDNNTDCIIAKKQVMVDAIVLKETSVVDQLSEEHLAELWLNELHRTGLSLLTFSTKERELIERWTWITAHRSDLQLPKVSEASLLGAADIWFIPYVGKVKNKKQLEKLNIYDMLLTLLSYQQQQLINKVAPTHFIGPTGRRCAIRYENEKSPTVSLPMQELYGLSITPCVGMEHDTDNVNAIPLKLEILSPAKRPIQITQNLVEFWKGSYKAVQKDMKSQYPKHYWPDDPANAKATNKTKRHIKE